MTVKELLTILTFHPNQENIEDSRITFRLLVPFFGEKVKFVACALPSLDSDDILNGFMIVVNQILNEKEYSITEKRSW